MAKRTYTAEKIVTILRQVEVAIANGKATPHACREGGITEQTYYRWRKESGGLKLEQARRLKELEKEYSRPKRLAAELSLEKQILQDVAGGNCKPRAAELRSTGCLTGVRDLRAPRVSAARTMARDSALYADGTQRRRRADPSDRRTVQPIRVLWASADRRAATQRRLGRGQGPGRAHLAPRGAQSTPQTTQAWETVAERWIVRAPSARATQPRVELRLRERRDP